MNPPSPPSIVRRLHIPRLELRLRGLSASEASARAQGLAAALSATPTHPPSVRGPNTLAQQLTERIAAALRKD